MRLISGSGIVALRVGGGDYPYRLMLDLAQLTRTRVHKLRANLIRQGYRKTREEYEEKQIRG